jgi:hypothetical protein
MEPHLMVLVEQNRDDAYLCLDLAQAYDRQGKTKEAVEQIDRFREMKLGDKRTQMWRYLRGLGLGKYIDEPPSGT